VNLPDETGMAPLDVTVYEDIEEIIIFHAAHHSSSYQKEGKTFKKYGFAIRLGGSKY